MRTQALIIAIVAIASFALLPTTSGIALKPELLPPGGTSDGTTPTLTPQGTTIVLPAGWPTTIVLGGTPINIPDHAVGDVSPLVSCSRYQAGWRQNTAFSYTNFGSSVQIAVQSMPMNTAGWCSSTEDMSYSTLMVFANGDYIQSGLLLYPQSATSVIRWCEYFTPSGGKHDFGGPTQVNGDVGWYAVIKDSSNVYRAYSANIGGVTTDMGCFLNGHLNSEGNGNQYFGELTSVANPSTSTMGPFEFRFLQTLNSDRQWRNATSIQAAYVPDVTSTCTNAHYGAGTISRYNILVGSGRACTTGVFTYPGP